jgi:hypothetical protein
MPMLAKLRELITGKDDLERVAYREDLGQLNAYLRTRRLLIPKRPRRFLDAASFTREELLELLREEAEELAGEPFEPWVLEIDGKRRLPAFSSRKKMTIFSGEISKRLDKVFSLGCGEILLHDLVGSIDIDFIDLNPFSRKSWEIGVGEIRDQA